MMRHHEGIVRPDETALGVSGLLLGPRSPVGAPRAIIVTSFCSKDVNPTTARLDAGEAILELKRHFETLMMNRGRARRNG